MKFKRCKICSIVLDNERVCKDCGKIHGAFYKKYPDFCKACVKEYRTPKILIEKDDK